MRESLLASRPRLLGQWTLMGPLHEDPHHHNPPHHHHHENGDVEPHLLIHDTRAAKLKMLLLPKYIQPLQLMIVRLLLMEF